MNLPRGVLDRGEDLDGLHLAAPLAHGVLGPGLDVGGPGDQLLAVPEADGLAVPLRRLLDVALTDQHLADEVVGDARRASEPGPCSPVSWNWSPREGQAHQRTKPSA